MIRKLIFAGVFLSLILLGAQGGAAQEQAQGPYQPKIAHLQGNVSVNFSGEKWEAAQKGMVLNENAVVKTDSQSYCDVALDSAYKNIVSIGPNSEVTLGKLFKEVRIAKGRVFAQMKGLEPGAKFEISTPQAVAGVRGTAWESIVDNGTQFNVQENTINVQGFGAGGGMTGEKDVSGGQSLKIDANGLLGEVTPLSPEQLQGLQDWSGRIGQSLRQDQAQNLIDGYDGNYANLYEKVLETDGVADLTDFAAAEGGLGFGDGISGGPGGITGGDVTNTTFTEPPGGSGSDNGVGGGEDNPPPPPPPLPPPTCFLAGTIITMADGSTKPIEAVKVGDVVLSYDQSGDSMKPDTVKEVFVHPKESIYLIVNGNLKVTPNHIVLTKGQWRQIGELKVGDVLTNTKGEEVPIVDIAKVQETVDVYNFEVNPYHTYVANGLIVHNRKVIQPAEQGSGSRGGGGCNHPPCN